jgi:hypothetical protein
MNPATIHSIGGLKCPSCEFSGTTARALGRHQQAWSGRKGHPEYVGRRAQERAAGKRTAKKPTARPQPTRRAKALEGSHRLTPSGKVKDLKQAVLTALDELAIYAEVQAEAVRDLTTERDRLAAQLQRLDQAYQAIKGKRLPS